jgi:hypothetical protein
VAGSCKHDNGLAGFIKPGNFWKAEDLFIRFSRRILLHPVDISPKCMGSTASHPRRPESNVLLAGTYIEVYQGD